MAMGGRSPAGVLISSWHVEKPKSSVAMKPIGNCSVGLMVRSGVEGLVMRTVGAASGVARMANSSGRLWMPAASSMRTLQMPSRSVAMGNCQV